MTSPAIRKAVPSDAPAIAHLTEELGYPVSVAEIEGRLNQLLPRGDFFVSVAEVESAVIGWVAAEHRVLLEFEPRVELVGLVVAESHRRSGIGRALVSAAERWQRERGISTIFVRSNVKRSESHPFYERLGYTCYKTQHAYIKRVDG